VGWWGWCDLEFGSVWGLCHYGGEVVFRGAGSKTLYTYTLVAITPHNSTLRNTTLHKNSLLQDRQL